MSADKNVIKKTQLWDCVIQNAAGTISGENLAHLFGTQRISAGWDAEINLLALVKIKFQIE